MNSQQPPISEVTALAYNPPHSASIAEGVDLGLFKVSIFNIQQPISNIQLKSLRSLCVSARIKAVHG